MTEAPVITAIDVVTSDPNLRMIRVGDRTVATLAAREVDGLELSVGLRLTADVESQIELALIRGRTRHDALALLARRAWSRSDMRGRLLAKSFPEAVVDDVVSELVDDGWLDDETFARDLAAEVLRRQPASADFVRARLIAKGLDEDLADRIAREATAEIDDDDAALAIAKSHRGTGIKLTRRIAAALARRGYDEDTIRRTLDHLGLLDPPDPHEEHDDPDRVDPSARSVHPPGDA